MICAVAGCCELASDKVTVWLHHLAASETRELCAKHAAEVRAWARAEGVDRPRSRWVKPPRAPSLVVVAVPVNEPACAVCGVVKRLHRRGICQACIQRAARADRRARLAG